MFQKISILCFVTILFATRNGSATVFIAKDLIGLATNFSDIVPCVTWKSEDGEVTLPMLVVEGSTGIYRCTTSEDVVLFVAYEIITFMFVSDPAIYQEKVSVNCYTRFWPKNFDMTSSLTIFNNSNKVKDSVMEDVSKGSACENECYLDVQANTPGEFPYSCDWNITIKHEGTIYKYGMSLPKTLRVFLPVRNVRVNKTETKAFEMVECYADGFPEPDHFEWTCRTSIDVSEPLWSTQGRRITFFKAREYKCICNAYNMGVDAVNSGEWAGVIVVQPADVDLDENDKEESPSEGETEQDNVDTDEGIGDKKQVTKNKTGGKKKGKKKTDTNVKQDKKSPVGSGSPSDHDSIDPFAISLTVLIYEVIVEIGRLLLL